MNAKKILGIMGIAILSFVSCKKYNSLGYTPGTGAPTITSIHTYGKTDSTVIYDTVTIVVPNGDGTTHDSIILDQLPYQAAAYDSVVTQGIIGSYYVIHGTNLGSTETVSFNGTNAYFNRAFSTDQSIIVEIPSNTPYRKPAATDTLTIVTTNGTLNYYFPIVVPAPTINTVNGVSEYDFIAGSLDTLYGIGFDVANAVFVKGISTSAASAGVMTQCTIVSQSPGMMILQFPKTTLTQGNLAFAYTTDEGAPDTAVSTVVFNDIDNAYQILGPNMTATSNPAQTWAGSAVFQSNGAWTNWYGGSWSSYSTGNSPVQGIANISFYSKFDNGGWKVGGFQFNAGIGGTPTALAYDPSWQYLSFWVLNTGASVVQTAYIQWGNGGFGQNKVNPITIQPGVWQFFKIPISSLNWNTGTTPWSANSSSTLANVGFFMTCQDASGNNIGEADLYFTDVALIK